MADELLRYLDDPEALVRSLSTMTGLRGDGDAWLQSLLAPTADMALELEGILVELADPEQAGAFILEAYGLRNGVGARAGMDLAEYRRLVVGSMSIGSAHTWAGIVRLLKGLAGPGPTDVFAARVNSDDPYPGFELGATVAWTPSLSFRRRAGRLIRRAAGGVGSHVVLSTTTTMLWGTGTWGQTWGYPLTP